MFKHSSKSSIQRRLYINHDEHMEQFFRHPRRSPGGVLPVSNTAPPSISIDQVCLFLTSDNCSHTVCTICKYMCTMYILYNVSAFFGSALCLSYVSCISNLLLCSVPLWLTQNYPSIPLLKHNWGIYLKHTCYVYFEFCSIWKIMLYFLISWFTILVSRWTK